MEEMPAVALSETACKGASWDKAMDSLTRHRLQRRIIPERPLRALNRAPGKAISP